jgi:hypothetical protein
MLKISRPFILAALATPLLLATPAPSAPAVGVRDLTGDEYQRMLELVMDGRADQADSLLAAVADTCAGQPLYLLARARLNLEAIPVDDDDKTVTRAVAEPTYDLLEQVIAHCDAGLEADDDRLDLRFYRGWAWMVHSQLKAFARSFYSAGRDAGRGKDDLEAYLAVHPADPIANGLLGSYLYFTDAVPRLFQLLSRLLMLPTGDRERGLAMIDRAVATESPARVDFEVLDAAVTFFFEGRLTEGLALADDLVARYPHYPRLAAPVAVMAAMDPRRAPEHLARVERMLAGLPDGPGVDASSRAAVRGVLGWSARIVAGHARARAVLEDLATSPPPHPDWIAAHARLQLAEMAALEGRTGEARRLAELVRDDPLDDRFGDRAEAMLDALDDRDDRDDGNDRDDGPADPVDDAWVAALYAAGPDSLAMLGDRLAAGADASVRAAFHAADARLLGGDRTGARRAFRELHGREVAPWERVYRLLAAARLGELAAASGNLRSAASWFARAAEDHGGLYRMEWLLRGRERYLAELHDARRSPPVPVPLARDDPS